MKTETNRAVSYFEHRGEAYKIHERSNPLHDGTRCTRRFIVRRSDDRWSGEANNVRDARKVLDQREAKP